MRNNVRQLDTASEMAHKMWVFRKPDEALYDQKGPRIIEITSEGSDILALTLSSELGRKIQRALCLGRVERLLAPGIKKSIKEAEKQQTEQVIQLEIHEFYADLLKRNMENEPGGPTIQQKKDYEMAIQRCHIVRYNQKVALSNLESAETEAKLHSTQWTDALAAVNKILDEVWTEGYLLKTPDHSSDDSSDDGAGDAPPQPSPPPQSPDHGGRGGAMPYDDDDAGDPPPQSPDFGAHGGAPPYDDDGRGRRPSIEHDQGFDPEDLPLRKDPYGNWRRVYPGANSDFHRVTSYEDHPVRDPTPRSRNPQRSQLNETPNLYRRAESSQTRLSGGIKRKHGVELAKDEPLPAQKIAAKQYRQLHGTEPDLLQPGNMPTASTERGNKDALLPQQRRNNIGGKVSI